MELNTSFIENIRLNESDNSIEVNKYLQTEINDIYAAGDVANFPYAPMGESTRIEHWRLAAQQGRIGAINMLHKYHNKGKSRSVVTVDNIVPFFSSGLYDL